MKTAVLTGTRKIEIHSIPEPQIKHSTDVILKIGYVGVCGSDIHYYMGGRIGDQVVGYPFIVGHECSAVVHKVGANVTRTKSGDRVAIEPAVSCGKCPQCLIGRPNTCLNLKFLGCPGQLEGCLSEYIVMPQESCYPIPSKMTLIQSALVEPLSIGLYAVQLLNGFPAEKIGIFGVGPIGLSVLLAAKHTGISSIYVTDEIDHRIQLAKSIGAKWSGSPDNTNIVAEIKAQEPFLLDAIFECCGDQTALDQAIELLRPGGKLFVVGIPESDRISFDIHQLRRNEITIQNVRRQNNYTQIAIDLIQNMQIDVDFMATHFFTLEQTSEAFELVNDYRDGVIKAMIHF